MTEDEWVRVDADEDLWRALVPLGQRRRRLLASALVRALGRRATDSDVAIALKTSDRFADTGKSRAALRRAGQTLYQAAVDLGIAQTTDPIQRTEKLRRAEALYAATAVCEAALPGAAVRQVTLFLREAEGLPIEEARRRLYPVYREIAGPTPSVAFDPGWLTSTAVALARQMYDARDFSLMPILADALQDAGCENDDILDHCRDPQLAHVRGCWVVDLVLGKS